VSQFPVFLRNYKTNTNFCHTTVGSIFLFDVFLRMFAAVFISMEMWDVNGVNRWRDGEWRIAGCWTAWSVGGYWKEVKREEEQDMKWHLSPKNCQSTAKFRDESLKRKGKGTIQFLKVDVSQNKECKKKKKNQTTSQPDHFHRTRGGKITVFLYLLTG